MSHPSSPELGRRGVWIALLIAGVAVLASGLPWKIPASSDGEVARWVADGDVVHVNNGLCAVCRSPMADNALGRFVSRVGYTGADPRFVGKTFEFNQCCAGCVDRFPEMWHERTDEILAFHGVLRAPATAPAR
jgi:hypothetical protein